MADIGYMQMFLTALGGGFTVKLVDIFYQELRLRKQNDVTTTQFLDQHIEPLLKAADELVGKVRALAEADFKQVARVDPDGRWDENDEFAGLVFLFGRLWAQIEAVRHKALSGQFSNDERGRQILAFFDCIESRRVRIVPRIIQRAVGEVFLAEGEMINFITFHKLLRNDEDAKRWVSYLVKFLSRTEHTTERQQLLQYGIVIHAMIDTLDPDRLVTRERPSWSNKLTFKSWKDLRYRVFNVYLDKVPNRQKYLGPSKRTALNKRGEGGARRL
jgi:hypothetical protein